MHAKPCCLSLAAHLCPLHHVPPLSGRRALAVLIWPQHDWWLGWGACTGSSPLSCQQGACLHMPLHHQPLFLPAQLSGFPKQRLPFPRNKPASRHLSQLELCSFVRICSLPPRAGVKLHSFVFVKLHSFVFVKLHYFVFVKHANVRVQELSGACSFFMITISK